MKHKNGTQLSRILQISSPASNTCHVMNSVNTILLRWTLLKSLDTQTPMRITSAKVSRTRWAISSQFMFRFFTVCCCYRLCFRKLIMKCSSCSFNYWTYICMHVLDSCLISNYALLIICEIIPNTLYEAWPP
jgi:hypothetical protein